MLLSKAVTVPETTLQRKIIVFKPSVGMKAVRNIASKAKDQYFKKYLLIKAKPEETKIDTIDRYYEKYVVIDGAYNIKYSKKWTHSINIHEEMNRLKIGNKNFEPNVTENHLESSSNTLMLKGTGHFHKESQMRMIFDSEWNEVGIEQLPYLSFEEDPQEILEPDQLTKEDSKADKEVEILKSKIFKRPNDILKIHNEDFKITERAVIFKPMYKVSVSHIETKNKATFLIDGSNGKITSKQKRKMKPSPDDLKELTAEAYTILKNKTEQINSFLKKLRKKAIGYIKLLSTI
jgi:hypothetical protein